MSLILIDKPEGPTSHAVVSVIKRILGAEKVGHLGTLDPFASGLLPVLVGNTARLADEAMDGEKGYRLSIELGRETDTLDPTGRVVAEAPLPSRLSEDIIEGILASFRGRIEQTPPVYSALKMNGMPLYEHMRATGRLPMDIESKRRSVMIHSLALVSFSPNSLCLRVVCSKGTYIRSLARDIGKALNSVGICKTLRREWVEPWHVDSAFKIALDPTGRIAPPGKDHILEASLPAWKVAPKIPRAVLGIEQKKRFLSGNTIDVFQADLTWETEITDSSMSQSSVQEHPKKALIQCDDVQFLCEIAATGHGQTKIQPRKRIH